jgi:hypothetical protein
MKVVFKVTVYDRIVERLHEGVRQGRKPEYIVVTREEYAELRNDERTYSSLSPRFNYLTPSERAPAEATFTVREFPRTSGGDCLNRHDRIRVVSHENFQGVPLFGVPAAFHPK